MAHDVCYDDSLKANEKQKMTMDGGMSKRREILIKIIIEKSILMNVTSRRHQLNELLFVAKTHIWKIGNVWIYFGD